MVAIVGVLALLAASSIGAAAARPSGIVAINNANAWFVVSYPGEACGYDIATLTVAEGFDTPTGGGGRHYFAWADVGFFHSSGCETQTISREMYGSTSLDPATDFAIDELSSAWVRTSITLEGGGETRTLTFDLAWIASGFPRVITDAPGHTLGQTGRYVEAHLAGTVGDSGQTISIGNLSHAELSVVQVRLK